MWHIANKVLSHMVLFVYDMWFNVLKRHLASASSVTDDNLFLYYWWVVLGAIEREWNYIKECVLDTLGDLVGKVEKRARKPWITQEMITKMDERRKLKNVNTEEGKRNYRRLRNELKRTTEKAVMIWCTWRQKNLVGRRPKGFKILASKTPRRIE